MSESHCLFKDLLNTCPKDDNVVAISKQRMSSVVQSSKKRRDSIFDTASQNVTHKNCLSTYTSRTHINRHLSYLKRKVSSPQYHLQMEKSRHILLHF